MRMLFVIMLTTAVMFCISYAAGQVFASPQLILDVITK